MNGHTLPCDLGIEVASLQSGKRGAMGSQSAGPTSAGHLHQPPPTRRHGSLLLPSPELRQRRLGTLMITALSALAPLCSTSPRVRIRVLPVSTRPHTISSVPSALSSSKYARNIFASGPLHCLLPYDLFMVPSFPGDGLGSPSQADWGPLRTSVLCDPSLLANKQGGPQGPSITFRGCAPRRVSWRLRSTARGWRPRASCLPGNARLRQLHVRQSL